MNNLPPRILSIDIFRALTMMLMIFVNDFWSLTGVPLWLEHAKENQDFLGFSDIIFPCFLFIVGMSIPYAIRSRLAKGESRIKIMSHIFLRSLSLLVMGFFTVNIGRINENSSGISREWFEILMVVGFFLRKVIGRKAQNHQAFVFVLAVNRFESLVLRREATVTGGIDHQYHLATVLTQRLRLLILESWKSMVQQSGACHRLRLRRGCWLRQAGRQGHKPKYHGQ